MPQRLKSHVKWGMERRHSWLPADGGVSNHGSDHIRIHVRSWPSIFEITCENGKGGKAFQCNETATRKLGGIQSLEAFKG